MALYADYVFYKDNYHGEMTEEEWLRFSVRANQKLRHFTFNRIVPDTMLKSAQFAECEIADALWAFNTGVSGAAAAGAIASENTDGFSVSYTTLPQRALNSAIRGIVANWLSAPVNLTYCGGG